MKVNIVMLVKDRPKLTDQALNSLFKNTNPELFNITIVDDGSKDPVMSTLSYAKTSMHPEIVAVLRVVTSKGITGMARNLGVYWAEKYWGRGDYLYLMDNDTYQTPGWLDKLTTAFNDSERHGFKLMGGWNHPFLQPHGGIPTCSWGHYGYCSHDAITGASQLMRWATWDKYGPLDAHTPGVCQSEDWSFCQKIIKDGGKVGSIYPRCVLNTGLTNSFGVKAVGEELVLKELQEAKKQHSDLYWE